MARRRWPEGEWPVLGPAVGLPQVVVLVAPLTPQPSGPEICPRGSSGSAGWRNSQRSLHVHSRLEGEEQRPRPSVGSVVRVAPLLKQVSGADMSLSPRPTVSGRAPPGAVHPTGLDGCAVTGLRLRRTTENRALKATRALLPPTPRPSPGNHASRCGVLVWDSDTHTGCGDVTWDGGFGDAGLGDRGTRSRAEEHLAPPGAGRGGRALPQSLEERGPATPE